MQLFIKTGRRYKPAPAHIVKEVASSYINNDMPESYTNPGVVKTFLRSRLGLLENENFAVMFLDNRHNFIDFQIMFTGTVNASHVHPREVIKRALSLNASAIILAHNHPSNSIDASQADRNITDALKTLANSLDIRLLDHIIVTQTDSLSFAENGYI